MKKLTSISLRFIDWNMEWDWRLHEVYKNKRMMIIGFFYMTFLSLMTDLPEEGEDWTVVPSYKRGPLVRWPLIGLYLIVLIIIYKDKKIFYEGMSNYT